MMGHHICQAVSLRDTACGASDEKTVYYAVHWAYRDLTGSMYMEINFNLNSTSTHHRCNGADKKAPLPDIFSQVVRHTH